MPQCWKNPFASQTLADEVTHPIASIRASWVRGSVLRRARGGCWSKTTGGWR